MSQKKLRASERREAIVQWLKEEGAPLKGGELAERAGVSRQVIVQDMSILRAKEEPVLATAHGYMYMGDGQANNEREWIAVRHAPDEMKDELYTFVDYGLTVNTVVIEHEVYGELSGRIDVSNRRDVDAFCERVTDSGSALLSQLTDGVHLHLVEASRKEQITNAKAALREKGFLIE
ncbi:transcription repressor NadR [Geomicrobium sp. JSM 1781026]|uniref:transcription repressor NadR n=1 Tax=Geomicrobium sp. JSM 1781026 TaxID=3344580 RepID=UPI0035BFF872